MNKTLSIHTLVGWGTFLTSLIVYTLTLEPTASFWDSGEFIASSYKLQIPHPPGPPLFLLIGRLFSLLAIDNLESIGFWVNMLSAVSSAFTVMFAYWIVVLLGKKIKTNSNNSLLILSGVVGSLAFAFSDTFWFSAVETEVYALSTTFIAIVVWAILKLDQAKDSYDEMRWVILIAYLMGLSIGVHPMSLLAIPTLVYIFYFKERSFSIRGLIISSALGLGLTLFMMFGFRIGLIGMIKNFELLFVNTFGLPFYTGFTFFGVALISLLAYGVYYSVQKNKIVLNTALLSISFVIIGYSSYTAIVIRSVYNPPIDQNNPENIPNLIGYLDMLQYGTRPLVYGESFTSQISSYKKGRAIYKKGQDGYQVIDHVIDYKYDSSELGFFPRMYSTADHHKEGYKNWSGLKEGQIPTFTDNLKFFFNYQLGHMYLRYFMWNFVGRQGDYQDASWLALWEDSSILPSRLKNNAAHNNFLFLPFLLGLLGCYFHYKKSPKSFLGVFSLFVVTGIGLVIYLNSPAPEPRERDYIYVASFLAFSIWIGLGTISIHSAISRVVAQKHVQVGAAFLTLTVPLIMVVEGWNDHDRSNRYFTTDIARNYLSSCSDNAILFTGGDNDTYPLWYAQEVEGFRTDIRAIVLSYFNAEWYIDQMNRQAYNSEPLPFSLKKENYERGGPNDFLYYVQRPNLTNKAIDLKQYLELIKAAHSALQVSTRSGEKINSFPSKNLKLHVDLDMVKEKHFIPDTLLPFLTSTLNIPVTNSALHKSDLMVLDLIASNNWKRPIYFTYTALNSLNFDISEMVVHEGYTYRLLPIKNPTPEITLVNTQTMYENLMDKFQWRELNNPKVNYTSYHKRQMTHARSNYNQLATTLIAEGEFEKAKKVLYRTLEVIPDDTIPYDVASINTAQLLTQVGEKEIGLDITKKMIKRTDEELDYYIEYQPQNSIDIRRNFAILSMLTQSIKDAGDLKIASETEKLLRNYYDKINQI